MLAKLHIAKVLHIGTYGGPIGYSPTVDLAAIGSCQGRDIELDRRVGAFQAVCLVQLLHNVPHFPIAFDIGYRLSVAYYIERQIHWQSLAIPS